jgi:activator of 2-hydroxyglutaryl-CoA dehydratase/predicted nucleotide-binding protein (sugar kinase/HSP70/actin superfamily)
MMTDNKGLVIEGPFIATLHRAANLYIDAGVSNIRILACDDADATLGTLSIPSNEDLGTAVTSHGLDRLQDSTGIFITGKLQETLRHHIGRGELILPAAALWSAACSLLEENPLGIIELSASGYVIIGIDEAGKLKDDMLNVNPRCGAGSGINLDRVLQKLNIERSAVDDILADYIGEENRARRDGVNIRADRCGVFAASATISDKNQGIPLDFALAVTLKSEVLKACKKLHGGFGTVWLSGGIFNWQYARDCAKDHLESVGATDVRHDSDGSFPLRGLRHLQQLVGSGNFSQPDRRVLPPRKLVEYPALRDVRADLEARNLYRRIPNNAPTSFDPQQLRSTPVMLGLDVGSTMAKLIISDAKGEAIFYKGSYSNAGDTIETIQKIFADIRSKGIDKLHILQVGLTGSARYQVQTALASLYPPLADRVSVLVENYAHAHGSIDYAREHIERLKAAGIEDLNEEFCLLVDIGGEDTKISSIALKKAELFDNAMNVKCSAGTGSLMDTLTAMFYLENIDKACELAYNADRSYAINATCAVFLMENARKLQAEGYGRDEILASANRAIVENMARTLWNQIELPGRTVALLHGQTMLSEPLPLAVADRMQRFVGDDIYCLVPPDPGHRACIGLIRTLVEHAPEEAIDIELDTFINKKYSKRIIQCKGAACGDAAARCNRSHLSSCSDDGKRFSFSLGGCTAINELLGARGAKGKGGNRNSPDTLKQIWSFIDERLPHSEDPNRLVIPRSFAVSEWAMFFASLFRPLGIPVEVDRLQDSDVIDAQPHFHIDTCAPHIGAVGQLLRLASQPHGFILAPQITHLPVRHSLGRTCTINQGGMAVARKLAGSRHPEARLHLFHISLKTLDAELIANKVYTSLLPVLEHYGKSVSFDAFRTIVDDALQAQQQLRRDAADYAARLASDALDEGREVALVTGREYILNPGIYDSHVGRLLRDKNMAGIPGYLLDVEYNPAFRHLYWRNPHMIATLADACARRELHKVTRHPGLKEVFRRIEEESDALMPVIQVSTFLCGPDSVTNQLIAELTRQRPYLLIQSDAVIKELAHLENRMNTYVKQLETGLHDELRKVSAEENFEVRLLDRLVNDEPVNPETDAIYLPTLSDHRVVTSIFRSAGFSCVDLYDENYDLQAAIKNGRSISGDAVCAPLAAVYGDVMTAIEDFKRRRKSDPAFANKRRLLIFNNKGEGPCRQGQYVETHKLFANRQEKSSRTDQTEEIVMQFLVGHEDEGYDFGLPPWLFVRTAQAIILQGVLHELLARGSSRCRDYADYRRFISAYRALKAELYDYLEHRTRPTPAAQRFAERTEKLPGLRYLVNYFAWGLHRRDLQRMLNQFASKWCSQHLPDGASRVHVDGEAYMRVAQFEEIDRALLATLGFRQFELTHTPVWSFLDYKIAGMLMDVRETISETTEKLQRTRESVVRKELKRLRRNKRKQLAGLKAIQFTLREVLARPLYRAVNARMPDSMEYILDVAGTLIPTKRPGGELVPYIGEALLKLREGYDLVLNVAPEGCMVSSMGEAITPGINAAAPGAAGKIQHLFSQQGDVDRELIALALLKTIGPERYYSKRV